MKKKTKNILTGIAFLAAIGIVYFYNGTPSNSKFPKKSNLEERVDSNNNYGHEETKAQNEIRNKDVMESTIEKNEKYSLENTSPEKTISYETAARESEQQASEDYRDYPQASRVILPGMPVVRLEVLEEESEMPISDVTFELKKENNEDIIYTLGKEKDIPYSTITNKNGIAVVQVNRCDTGGREGISKYILRAKGYYSKKGPFPLDEVLNHLSTHTKEISLDIISNMGLEYNQEEARSFKLVFWYEEGKVKDYKKEPWKAIYDLNSHVKFEQPATYTLLPFKAKMKKIPQNIKVENY